MLLVGVDEVNCWRQVVLKTVMMRTFTMVTKGAVAVDGRRAVEGRRAVKGRRAVEGPGRHCHWQLQLTCHPCVEVNLLCNL